MPRRLVKEPLLHFLLGGLALFILFGAINTDDGGDASPRLIRVDEASLLTLVQFRTRNFDEAYARTRIADLTPEAFDTLVQDYVAEEALHREALALGLDKGDYIIRRRLVQKVDYIAQGIVDDNTPPDDAAITAFYADKAADYTVAPSLTFTHIFFSADQHGWDAAKSLAESRLLDANTQQLPFDRAGQYGDLFPYHLNYVDRTPDYVASHFGDAMAQALLNQPADENTWFGPLRSDHGWHLVLLSRNDPAYTPSLTDIRPQIIRDLTLARQATNRALATDRIIDQYDIDITVNQQQFTTSVNP